MRRLWVPHPEQVWAPCFLHDEIDGVAMFGTDEGEALEIPAANIDELEEVYQQQVVGEEDVCLLDTVTRAALLHTIRVRFTNQVVYTWVSRILLAVNPFEALPLYSPEVLDQYRFAPEVRALPPHIFSIAADAVSNLHTSRRHQAIVINGESGAGKTESAKLIMSFIAEATKSDSQQPSQSFEDKVLRTNPVMEAFGNAMTVRNNNSSRFVKWLNFHTQDGRLVGCDVQQYLLEDTRICSVAKGERSYHVFFQLLQARHSPVLKELQLEGPEGYAYTRAGELTVPGIDDLQAFEELKEALDALGIDKSTQVQMWQLLAAVLWLGNCRFAKEDHHEGVKFEDERPVQQAARMLGLEVEELKKCMLIRKITVGKDLVETPQGDKQAKASRDSLSKYIYAQLFAWAVETLNQTLKVDSTGSKGASTQALGILDIAGFESFEHNSLEQLLINLCNEHLQQFFNNFVFRSELEDYAKEGLTLECEVEFVDNKEVLQLLDGRGGVLDVLDEEVVMPKATDESFASKLKTGQTQHPRFVKPKMGGKLFFGVKHFAGEVMYNCEGFLQKNLDKPPEDFIKLIPSSTQDLLKLLAKEEAVPSPGAKGRKPKSTSAKFRVSLRQLIGKIDVSDPHFVRCIKPNPEKVPNKFNSPLVLEQLLFSGILEAVQIRQKGFASRASFDDFIKRYGCIASSDSETRSAKDLVLHLKEKLKLDAHGMQVGKSKVFLKGVVLDQLEAVRAKARCSMALRLQAVIRARRAQKLFAAARPATAALKECLRRVGWEANAKADRLGCLVEKLGAQAKTFLAELQQAENALLAYPSSQRLREASQAVATQLTKELQCLEQIERLEKSTDAREMEKVLAKATRLKLPATLTTALDSRCKALKVQKTSEEASPSPKHAADDSPAKVAVEVAEEKPRLQPEVSVFSHSQRKETRIAEGVEATTRASSTVPREEDTSGDMVGVLVHLIDKSSQNLFVPVATTLKELSSLMGSRVGVKRWKDFAFFQATNQSDSLRMLPDMLPVSELISMWHRIKEATNLQGHLHWLRRFLRPQEMLLAGDLHHAALTFRQAVRSHLGRPVPCQAGAEAEEMATAAALMWLESYNPSQKIKDNDKLVCQLLKGQMSGLKPAQQDEVRKKLLAQVHDMRAEFGPRIPQLQRMTRAFVLMRRVPFFGAHRWPAKVIAPAKVSSGQSVVNNPPDRFLAVHARQSEPDVWVFVDTHGLHLAPAMSSHTNGAAQWSFHFQAEGTPSMHSSDTRSSGCWTPGTAASRRRSMTNESTISDDGAASTASSGRRNIRMYKQVGRLLRWGAKPGVLQIVVHTTDIGRSAVHTQLIALACPDAMDAAFVLHCSLCELLHIPITYT